MIPEGVEWEKFFMEGYEIEATPSSTRSTTFAPWENVGNQEVIGTPHLSCKARPYGHLENMPHHSLIKFYLYSAALN